MRRCETVSRHPELLVEVVSGGLFTGPRRVPIREFGDVQGANAQIAGLTGAEFGEGYERLIADGSFAMDSEAGARGVVALRRVAPDSAAELAGARPDPRLRHDPAMALTSCAWQVTIAPRSACQRRVMRWEPMTTASMAV